jgi:hypothetical protein
MSAPVKLAAFLLALAVIAGGAAVAGGAIDPDRGSSDDEGQPAPSAHGDSHGGGEATPEETEEPAEIHGLAVAENELRLVVDTPELERGRTERLEFTILGDADKPVTDFDVEHEKRLHLIVVRRDATGFQHLHPEMNADGKWSTDIKLDEPGSYRLYADFSHEGEKSTLATDLRVDGEADLQPLPVPSDEAHIAGGYDVHRDGLEFEITKDGKPITPDPYLGARGHLVALREGDLAYLHVHADEDELKFSGEFPTPGRYRLFLQFEHEGQVHTAEFTEEQR